MLALSKMESGAARYWVTVRNKPRFRVTVEEVNEDWIVTRHFGGGGRIVTQEAGPGPAASPGPVAVVQPVIEPAAVVIPEVKPVIVAGRECKVNPAMARFMAGKGSGPAVVVDEPDTVDDEPRPEPGPGAEPTGPYFGMTRQEWKWMGSDKQPRWLASHKLTFRDEAEYWEWKEGMPR